MQCLTCLLLDNERQLVKNEVSEKANETSDTFSLCRLPPGK